MSQEPFPFPNEVYPGDWFRELPPESIFADSDRPLEIDLGCGDGSFLAGMGEHFPEINFLGVERLLGRCRKVWKKSERMQLDNVKILRLDTNYAVRWLLPGGAVSRIHLLCPDPWPKKKHASRRQMCRLDFLESVHRLLVDDGEFLFKTDSSDYFQEAIEFLQDCPLFRSRDWPEDAFFYPQTDFETQWLAEGRTMNRLRLIKS